MNKIESVEKFKDQSSWRLLALGAITHGVYHAYYIQRQTAKINTIVDSKDQIPVGFLTAIIVVSYISLILFVAHFAFPKGHPVATFDNIFGNVWSVMVIVWAFKARNRLNSAFELTTQNSEWFHGLPTFIFSVMYLNYKINCICEARAEQLVQADLQDHSSK